MIGAQSNDAVSEAPNSARISVEAATRNSRTAHEDTLRKLAGLRRLRVDRGASLQEAETAQRISTEMMRKYQISAEDIIRFELRQENERPLDWTPWEAAAERQGLILDRFARCGCIFLPAGIKVFIILRSGNLGTWTARHGDKQIAAGASPDRLEKFLSERAPRRYSLRG
jgi:hypothetical protein